MAAKIVVLKDNQPIQEVVLAEEITVIGRKKECDIRIADSAVSGVHAQIVKQGGQYQIKDMDSTNGTHVRGQRIQEHALKSEDIVVVGEHELKFVDGDSLDQAASMGTQQLESKAAAAAPQLETYRTAYLLILTGKDKNHHIDLTEQMTSIGVPGIQVAAISQRRQGHYIVHVDGGEDRNRVPQVNGEPIGFRSRRLEPGDKIEVADMVVQYVMSDDTVIGVT